jgi:ATP-binding protein involved in chromosome partitioning
VIDPQDPRTAVIPRRLSGVGRILAVTGGKGGIGKSLVSSTLALVLAEAGRRVGLLDLDLTSPTDHVILGLAGEFPTEEFGLEPPLVAGVRFMSVRYFVGDRPAPMRGRELTDALIEILAVTRWQDLDVLVIDMPPGLGDTTLDIARLLPRSEHLVVASSSALVRETARRMLRLLADLRAPVAGVVANMARDDGRDVGDLAREHGVAFLGALPWDPGVEEALGAPSRLVATAFGRAVHGLAIGLGTAG